MLENQFIIIYLLKLELFHVYWFLFLLDADKESYTHWLFSLYPSNLDSWDTEMPSLVAPLLQYFTLKGKGDQLKKINRNGINYLQKAQLTTLL